MHTLKHLCRGALHWLLGILKALWTLWLSLGPRWLRVTVVVVVVLAIGWHQARLFLTPNLTRETVYQVRYLNDGWTQQQRQNFYYTPQGTELLGIE